MAETKGLTVAKNPQARMQELLKQPAPVQSSEDVPTPMSNHSNETMSKGVNEYSNDEVNEEASTDVPAPIRKPSRKPVKQGTSKDASTPAYNAVRDAISKPVSKEASIRLNVDVPVDLHERLKLYCLTRKTSLRVLVCALTEDFLKEEGF